MDLFTLSNDNLCEDVFVKLEDGDLMMCGGKQNDKDGFITDAHDGGTLILTFQDHKTGRVVEVNLSSRERNGLIHLVRNYGKLKHSCAPATMTVSSLLGDQSEGE